MIRPQLKFKVYVREKHGPRTPFFWCSIWRTLPQMRAHLGEINLTADTRRVRRNRSYLSAYGACYNWTATEQRGKRWILLPEMGVIAMAIAYTGASTISHECAHAAFRYIERLRDGKRRYCAEYCEELFCCVVGEMSRQIVRRLTSWDRRRKTA